MRHASRLAWGVWVEIRLIMFLVNLFNVTPRMRRVSWNQNFRSFLIYLFRSRLAWGVWVEIYT